MLDDPSHDIDDPEAPISPPRSPSRLDFCTSDDMEWSLESHNDDWWPYTLIDQDTLEADIAPHTSPHLLNEKPPSDDASDSPPMFFAPPDPIVEVVVQHIELQSPTPVRSSVVQMDIEPLEHSVNALESPRPPRITPHRLNYPHHGFSRSALHQQKMLWNLRQAEWMEWEINRVCSETEQTSDAYTALAIAPSRPRATVSPPSHSRTPPSGLERDLVDRRSGKREQDANAPIYPRVGDISALRDPFPVNMDRSFSQLPMWTLQKTLWSFDLQMRTGSSPPLIPAYNAANVQASVSASTLSSYSSAGDDVESDSTLVGDSPVSKVQTLSNTQKSASPPHSPTSSSWDSLCGWKSSWYTKWELLVAIYEDDPSKYTPCALTSKLLELVPEVKQAPLTPPKYITRFMAGDDEDMVDYNAEDEDEDYGTLLAKSSFNINFGSDEECERALSYYHSQLM